MSINQQDLDGLKQCFHLYPDFLSESEASELLHNIYQESWTTLNGRRVQQHGTPTITSLNNVCTPLPDWLETLADRVSQEVWKVLEESRGQKVNHALINEYRPGQGIMPHTDGLKYRPIVGTVSLGSGCLLKFTPSGSTSFVKQTSLEAWIPPNSLYIQHGQLYTNHLHGMDQVEEDLITLQVINPQDLPSDALETLKQQKSVTIPRTNRVSVTFRLVPSKTVGKGFSKLLQNLKS